MKPWVIYGLVRVGIFAAVFAGLSLTGIPAWLAALLAAVIGLCVAYLFFGRLREAVVQDVAARRSTGAIDTDADAEDRG